MLKPAGAPPRVEDSPHPPTPHAPPFEIGGATLDHGGQITIASVTYSLADRPLFVTDTHDIVSDGRVLSGTDRTTFDGWLAEWAKPVWLLRPHSPTIPTFAPPVAVNKIDRTGLAPLHLLIEWGDRLSAPMHAWSIDPDGNVTTDDGRFFPFGHALRERREDCEYFIDAEGYAGVRFFNGDIPIVYYLHGFGSGLSRVYLAPKIEPDAIDALRQDPLRKKILIGVGLAWLIISIATFGWFILPGGTIAGFIAWWLYYHPKARPMTEDYFA